jgi:hypothetical protein
MPYLQYQPCQTVIKQVMSVILFGNASDIRGSRFWVQGSEAEKFPPLIVYKW